MAFLVLKCRNPGNHRLCEQLWLRSCSNCWRIRDYFGDIPFIFRYPSSILSGEHPKPSVSIGIPSHSKPCFFLRGSTDKPSTNCYSCSPFFANIFLLLTFFNPPDREKFRAGHGHTLPASFDDISSRWIQLGIYRKPETQKHWDKKSMVIYIYIVMTIFNI